MKVENIWMEVGGITERAKKVDLTCFLLQQFAFKFNCEAKFERDYHDRNPWGGVTKFCHFNGYLFSDDGDHAGGNWWIESN